MADLRARIRALFATQGGSAAGGLAALGAVALIALIAAFAVFGRGGTPISASHVPPTVIDTGNAPTCADVGLLEALKLDEDQGEVVDNTYNVTIDGTMHSITIDVTFSDEGEPISFSWSSTLGIDAVIVKGGQGTSANLYSYNEATSDNGLVADFGGISFILFCYDAAGVATGTPTLTATPGLTGTPTLTATPGLTGTPTLTATPGLTGTPTLTATPGLTGTPTLTATPGLTGTPTLTPTGTVIAATSTPEATATTEATETAEATPTEENGVTGIDDLDGMFSDVQGAARPPAAGPGAEGLPGAGTGPGPVESAAPWLGLTGLALAAAGLCYWRLRIEE